MPIKYVPPRLWVIMAREANKAVVIRKGPRDWSRLSLWDTETDHVEHGQWLHARLYPGRCDLSPDGSLFIYFCYHGSGRNRRLESGYSYAYTAISHPPYFTALALWNAFDTWGGGGVFIGNRKVYISAGVSHPNHPLTKVIKRVNYDSLNEFDGVIRKFGGYRGWLPVDADLFKKTIQSKWWYSDPVSAFYHNSLSGDYRLERIWQVAPGTPEFSLYTVQAPDKDDPILVDGDLTWADWDQRGRLACAVRGALYILDPDNPNGERTLIADFNGQTFEGIRAPEWARQW